MNAIFCNANTLLDVSLIRELTNKDMNFVLITATEEVRHILKRYYGLDAASLDEYRTLDIYNHSSAAKYDYGNDEFLSILDRYKVLGDLAVSRKYVFFNRAFDHWNAYIEDNQIEFVIFKMVPHLFYDFVLHELCEEKEIKKVIIEKTYWEDIILLEKTFRHNDCLRNEGGIKLIKDLTAQIKVKKMPYWTEAKIANQIRHEKKDNNISGPLKLKNLVQKLVNLPGVKEYGFYNGEYRSIEAINRDGYLKRLGVRWKINKINNEIIREYNKFLTDYERIRNDKNIVFYLQCQPEKSTSPLGGKYSDQLLAIEDVLKWLPDGYSLLVKEHPSQFTQWQSLEKGRFPGYYKKITDLGCRLISHKIDNQQLFESSALTISITGSIVFEAWISGYKATFLGFPWYGIFNIKQVSCKKDILSLLNKPGDSATYFEKTNELNSVGFIGYADELSETKFLIENDMRLAVDQISNAINKYSAAE